MIIARTKLSWRHWRHWIPLVGPRIDVYESLFSSQIQLPGWCASFLATALTMHLKFALETMSCQDHVHTDSKVSCGKISTGHTHL